jgi:hypothetical protein
MRHAAMHAQEEIATNTKQLTAGAGDRNRSREIPAGSGHGQRQAERAGNKDGVRRYWGGMGASTGENESGGLVTEAGAAGRMKK